MAWAASGYKGSCCDLNGVRFSFPRSCFGWAFLDSFLPVLLQVNHMHRRLHICLSLRLKQQMRASGQNFLQSIFACNLRASSKLAFYVNVYVLLQSEYSLARGLYIVHVCIVWLRQVRNCLLCHDPVMSVDEHVKHMMVLSRCYWATMRRKLGLLQVDEAEEDQELVTDLLQVMHDTGADFTNTFRRLATFLTPSSTGKLFPRCFLASCLDTNQHSQFCSSQ